MKTFVQKLKDATINGGKFADTRSPAITALALLAGVMFALSPAAAQDKAADKAATDATADKAVADKASADTPAEKPAADRAVADTSAGIRRAAASKKEDDSNTIIIKINLAKLFKLSKNSTSV